MSVKYINIFFDGTIDSLEKDISMIKIFYDGYYDFTQLDREILKIKNDFDKYKNYRKIIIDNFIITNSSVAEDTTIVISNKQTVITNKQTKRDVSFYQKFEFLMMIVILLFVIIAFILYVAYYVEYSSVREIY